MAREKRYPFGGKVPVGYKKDENFHLSLVKSEVEIIKDLFYKYAYELKTEHEVAVIAREKYNLKLSKSNIKKFLIKDVYWGFVKIDSEKFFIIEPILSEQDFIQLKQKGFKNSFSKHDYKFRNKVFINGRLAKHQTKTKNENEYKYYYLRGYPYIEEREICKHLIKNKFLINDEGIKSIEEKGVQLFRALLYCDIDKIQFDEKLLQYKKEIKRREQRLQRIDIKISENGLIEYEIL